MPVTTRKTLARELEEKLRVALQDLQKHKDLSDQLLQEREDSEVEVNKIVSKNTELKSELASLYTDYSEVLQQNEQLQNIVLSFKECSETHEQALSRISELEFELSKAQHEIMLLNSTKFNEQAADTLNLYNELVGSGMESASSLQPIVTIDLTDENTTCSQFPVFQSHKKIKKYFKLKKVMWKCKKQLKNRNYFKRNVNLVKDKLLLQENLQNCLDELEITKQLYDDDTLSLRSELLEKEKLLQNIFSSYLSAQNHLSDHYKEAISLMDLVTTNVESVRNIECACSRSHSQPQATREPHSIPTIAQPLNKTCTEAVRGENQGITSNQDMVTKVLVFSDAIGKNFGSLLGNSLNCSVRNYCMPGASYAQIEEKIMASEIDKNTIVIVYLGQSLGIDRKQLIASITSLLNLDAYQIMLCAFPYSDALTQSQNEHIHSLNTILYNMTCRHGDKLLFFDCNKFITHFMLTQDRMYLPKKYKNLIATLVAYNIESVIGNITKSSFDATDFSTCTNVQSNSLNF